MTKCDFPGCEKTDAEEHHALRNVPPFNLPRSGIVGAIKWRNEPDHVQRLCREHHHAKGHDSFRSTFGWPPGLGFADAPFLRGDPGVERRIAMLCRRPGVTSRSGLRARRSPRPADRDAAGGVANLMLYDLCSRHPDHADVGATEAKLAMIGRYYSASPKRGVRSAQDGDPTGFFERLARRLKTTDLDTRIECIRSVGRVDRASLASIVDTLVAMSNDVVSFINDDWGEGVPSRRAVDRTSFCSKYLHFHVPDAFFIYDGVIKRRLGMKAHVTYREFCTTMLDFAENGGDADWTPRSIDMEVYGYGDPGNE